MDQPPPPDTPPSQDQPPPPEPPKTGPVAWFVRRTGGQQVLIGFAALMALAAVLAVVAPAEDEDEDLPTPSEQRVKREWETLNAAWLVMSTSDKFGLCDEFDTAPNLTIRTLSSGDISADTAEDFLNQAC